MPRFRVRDDFFRVSRAMKNNVFIHRRGFSAGLATVALAGLLGRTGGISAQEPPTKEDIQAYTNAITQAQADLDAGKIAEAKATLEKTEKSLRSFEYSYLLARASAAAEGK